MKDTPEQTAFRIAVTLRICHLLRLALETNGNHYHGGLIPNLTSIADALTIPFDILQKQVELTPQINPDIEFRDLKVGDRLVAPYCLGPMMVKP